MTKKIVLAGGGTAGHVNPLLSTALELRSRGYDVVALGTSQGLETTLVPAAGVVLESVLAFELAKEILEEFQSNQMSSLIKAVKCHREAMRDF